MHLRKMGYFPVGLTSFRVSLGWSVTPDFTFFFGILYDRDT
jgi:hypothetical protein